MAGLTRLPQGNTAYDWNLPAQSGPAVPSAAPSSLRDQIGAQVTTLDRMLTTPNAMPPGRMPPAAPNPWRDIQSFVGKTMAVVTAPIDMLNQAAASLTFPLAMMLPAFPAVRLFVDLTLTIHVHPHPPTFGIPIPAVGPCVAAGACTVLINGLPAARSGDFGLSAWCGGYFPVFEVVTGSSHCMIQGARPARVTDITLHCTKTGGLGAIGVGMMLFSAAMGAVGVMAAETDAANALAADAAAEAAAAAVEASAQSLQLAADCAAMALSIMMGMDPAVPPAIGMFITGSPDVLIGGFPMPGWMVILKGLLKILRMIASAVQLMLPKGSKLRNALCSFTGHPVDVATGRMYTSETDFAMPGRIPISFTRLYDTSATGYIGAFGPGWIHPYEIHLWIDDHQNMVVLRNEEARVIGFSPIPVGGATYNPLEKLWLERLSPEVYVVRTPAGKRYIFTLLPSRSGHSETEPYTLASIEDHNNNRLLCGWENGRLRWIENDARRRAMLQYNRDGRISEIRFVVGQRTALLARYTYDREGRLIGAMDHSLVPLRYEYQQYLMTKETKRSGLSFYFAYESEGENARCVRTWGDGGIYARRLTYSTEEQTTTMRDSLGAVTVFHWNELDLITRIVEANGAVSEMNWSPSGELLVDVDGNGNATRFSYDDFGNLTSMAHPDGAKQEFAYDALQRPLAVTDENGGRWAKEYDARGNIAATINPMAARTEFVYNDRGDIVERKDPAGGIARLTWSDRGELIEITDPDNARTTYRYDEQGRLVERSDPSGTVTRWERDNLGRRTRIERADGVHRYEYDVEGNVVQFTDALGRQTRFRYQGFNQPAERTDPAGLTRRFEFDTEGRVTAIRNERGEEFRFGRDAVGRVVRETTFEGATWEYAYDPAGNIIGRRDPAGRATRIEYDPRGRVVRRLRADGIELAFRYDRVGNIVAGEIPGALVEAEYDAAGRRVREVQNGRAVAYEFDARGRRTARIAPSGSLVKYRHTLGGRLSGVETGAGAITIEHDPASRTERRTLTNHVRETRTFNSSGWLAEQVVSNGQTVIGRRSFTYDPEGNLTRRNDSADGAIGFAYDGRDQLIEAGTIRFEYDSTFNLRARDGERNQYARGDRLVRQGDAVLTYDAAGNLLEKRQGDSVTRYSYNADNQLLAAESSSGWQYEFQYDAFGRRTHRRGPDGDTEFLWDGDVLLAERHQAREIEYVFKPESFDPLCRLEGGKFQAYHLDQIGMPREITDARGVVVWAASYDPFGMIRRLAVSETDNRLRFPGQYDDGIGLFYNRYRYYDPAAARYITQDPLGIQGGLNFYRYTRNPLVWDDPFGLLDPYEVQRYGNTGHSGDGMDAHELLQSAWLKENLPSYEGRSKGMGRDNPAMALPPDVHKDVSALQNANGLHDASTLRKQTAAENIDRNADLLLQALIDRGMDPEEAAERVSAFREEALAYAKKYKC